MATGSPHGPAAVSAFDRRFPALARQLPRIPLGSWPTPLEPAPALARALALPELWVKRDDQCGTAYGGNKVRKLEYLLTDALARGADAVLTYGAAGSNHALATAVYARQLGLRCHAILTDQAPTPYVADTLRYHAWLGTRLHPARTFAETQALAATLKAEHPGGPDRLYEIPWGGSSWLGTVGFVAAAFELAAQLEAQGLPAPARVYLPCGSLGSVAGLALGLRVAGLPTVVEAVKVIPQNAVRPESLAALFTEVSRELHQREPAFPLLDEPLSNLQLRSEFLGPGYAQGTPLVEEAIALAREDAGFKVDVTYSGKALAGLLADARAGRLGHVAPLFWLTLNSRPYPEGVTAIPATALPPAFRHFLP